MAPGSLGLYHQEGGVFGAGSCAGGLHGLTGGILMGPCVDAGMCLSISGALIANGALALSGVECITGVAAPIEVDTPLSMTL